MKTPIAGFFSVVLFCASAAFAVFGAMQTWTAWASASWPAVTGEITYAAMQPSGSGTSYAQTPVVAYQYDVAGQTYRADRIAFGPTPAEKGSKPILSTDRRDQILAFGQRRVGDAVNVYHDPESPRDAVLIPGVGTFVLVYLFAAALCGAMSVILWLIASGRVKT